MRMRSFRSGCGRRSRPCACLSASRLRRWHAARLDQGRARDGRAAPAPATCAPTSAIPGRRTRTCAGPSPIPIRAPRMAVRHRQRDERAASTTAGSARSGAGLRLGRARHPRRGDVRLSRQAQDRRRARALEPCAARRSIRCTPRVTTHDSMFNGYYDLGRWATASCPTSAPASASRDNEHRRRLLHGQSGAGEPHRGRREAGRSPGR